MRAALLLLPPLLLACGGQPAPTASDAAATKTAPPAAVDAGAKKKAKGPEVTKEQRRAYREHLSAGRKLEAAKKYGEAVAEFEAALKAIPLDHRALGELGWAAFEAGDFAKAKAANADAIRLTSDPKVKAMSLYNQGRVQEATGDVAGATASYKESLALRPNKTVEERLAKLGVTGAALTAVVLPCAAPQPEGAVCGCLAQARAADMADPTEPPQCGVDDLTGAPGIKVAALGLGSNDFDYYLLATSPAGLSVIGTLPYFYEGGVAGVSNERSVAKVEVLELGGRKVLRVETVISGSDSDRGIDEVTFSEDRTVTLCVLGDKPTCPLEIPVLRRTSRERLGTMEDSEIDAETRKLMSADIGKVHETVLEVQLDATGMATVTLKKGTAPERADLLGPHKLW